MEAIIEPLHSCVLKWNDDVAIPFYTNYFSKLDADSTDLPSFLIPLYNCKVDVFVESLVVKYDYNAIIEYCKWMFINDLYITGKKDAKWPAILKEKPFARYLIFVAYYLIFNLSEKKINIRVLKEPVWRSVTLNGQKYWPEYLHDLLLPLFSDKIELFELTLELFITENNTIYRLSKNILYGFNNFNSIDINIKKSIFNKMLLKYYNNMYRKNISELRSILFPNLFCRIKKIVF